MPFQPVLEPQPLLVPPLLPPLALRTENGFFGAPRGDVATFGDCPPCTSFEEPPFPPPDDLPVLQAGAATVISIGVQRLARVPLFRAGSDAPTSRSASRCTSRSASTSGPWPRSSPRPWSWAARSRSSTANRGSSATTGYR